MAVQANLEPLAEGGPAIPVVADDGTRLCALWTAALDWSCRGQALRLRVLAGGPLALPDAEASEPVPGAIARVLAALRGSGAVLMLVNPDAALGAERIALAEGVRLFAITDAADEACWDAVLALGQPVYGVRGRVRCTLRQATPAAVLSALTYGLFTCDEGLALAGLDEDTRGVRYRLPPGRVAACEVVVRGGFAAARLTGERGEWLDRGNEGYVRLVLHDAQGSCWTQPRFVAHRGGAHERSGADRGH